ncbi:MAG: hypothetical protein JXR39_02475 [Marinilabiliaceae bacterium]|nr:hypothetical protein [Marinilabiliaceae bacterium]
MFRFIFINLLLALPLVPTMGQQSDSIPGRRAQSIAVGIDLAPFIIRTYDDSRTGLCVSGRYGLRDKIFGVAELGYENVDFSNNQTVTKNETDLTAYQYAHTSNGSFLRAGLDFNFFKPYDEPYNKDFVGVGFRYGYAYQEQQSPAFIIGNGYWNDYSGGGGSSSVNSHWIEVVFALRTELFRNFYAGWSMRGKMLVHSGHTGVMEPYAIPGYGKNNGNLTVGFTYSLEYQIPFGKRQ